MTKFLMLTSPHTDSGKTLVTLWLMMQAKRMGYHKVRAIKLGPDYLDAHLLSCASDEPTVNLEPWAMRPSTIAAMLGSVHDCDLVLIEAMMGLFDSAQDQSASPADFIAKWQIPWILVASGAKVGQSLAYMLKGLLTPDIPMCQGLVLNRIASERHYAMIKGACQRVIPELPLRVSFKEDKAWSWPHQYLGLRQGGKNQLDRFSKQVMQAQTIEGSADTLLECANTIPLQTQKTPYTQAHGQQERQDILPPPGKTVAIAYDEAFSFLYHGQISYWQENGVSVTFFSPLANESVPQHVESVLIPGGYPEFFLERLTQAYQTVSSLRQFVKRGGLVYGECGGAAILGNTICDQQGAEHTVWGFLSFQVSYKKPHRTLGYRRVQTLSDSWLGATGTWYRGHQFHFGAVSVGEKPRCHALWRSFDARGTFLESEGLRNGSVMGTFIHLLDREKD